MTTRATCVLAPNPGVMTLDGTNTWVLREPGADQVVVVDPGPLDGGHLAAVQAVVADTASSVALVLLTHRHADHAESAVRFAELTGAPVRALGVGHDDLAGGDAVRVAGLDLVVVATPGHTSDSLSLVVPADAALLSGDTVLGRGTTVVAWPDGELGSYLDSLERIGDLTGAGAVRTILPGHGPCVYDAAAMVRGYLTHRHARLDQVREARAAGARDVHEVLERVYWDVPLEVWPAAELSVRAQLAYLDRPSGPAPESA
ncbi:MAG TPA: MBL fold metallo-hydrolase [Candidatus Lustribacter sp.]|nr:MBL fold metallo-hydrolase [Candidatus Lustribacter sp.]